MLPDVTHYHDIFHCPDERAVERAGVCFLSHTQALRRVAVSLRGNFLSARIRPGERDRARLPILRHGHRGRHHHVAILDSPSIQIIGH
jgi:hypothetical protein